MAIAADQLNLLFKIRADSKDAKDEIKGFRDLVDRETKSIKTAGTDAFGQFGKSVGLSTESLAKLKAALPLIAGGIGAVGAAAVGAGVAIFGIVKNASDAGSELFDLSKKTGIAGETLSALKFAAEQSGSSIGEVGNAVVIFQKKLTDAAQGNEKLAQTFRELGIDIEKGIRQPEVALDQFIRRFNSTLPEGFNKTTLAAELFGRSGANLISTFESMGGSLDEFVAKAKALGVTLTEEDIKAADEFGDTLDALGAKAEAVANKFGTRLAPTITKAMEDISAAFDEHQGIINSAIAGTVIHLDAELGKLRLILKALELAAAANPFAPGVGISTPTTTTPRVEPPPGDLRGATGKFKTAPGTETDQAAKAANRERERQADVLDRLRKELERVTLQTRTFNEESSSQEVRLFALNAGYTTLTKANRELANEILKNIATEKAKLDELEKQNKDKEELRAKRLEIEKGLLAELGRQLEMYAEEQTQLQKVNALITDANVAGVFISRIENQLRFIAALNDTITALERVNELQFAQGPVTEPKAGQRPGQEGGPRVTEEDDLEMFGVKGPPVMDIEPHITAIGTLKDFAMDAFGGIAQAFGSMVQGFIMGEKMSGKAFLAMAKGAIAALAVEAGVKALFQLAEGIAWLFVNPAKSATHFAAAKVYAIVAGIGAAAALAIPGGGGGGSAVGGFVNSGAGGFSNTRESERDRTIREGRTGGGADPLVAHVHLHGTYAPGIIVEEVKKDYNQNGVLRSVFRSDMLGEPA